MTNVIINNKELDVLLICALRYCQGRKTYMPSLIQDIAKKYLKDISTSTLECILRDLRDQDENEYLFGDVLVDKPGWLNFREIIINELSTREN